MLLGQRRQHTAPHRFHDPHRNVVFVQQLYLRLRILEGPVHIIELYLAKLHMLAVGFKETLHNVIVPMG